MSGRVRTSALAGWAMSVIVVLALHIAWPQPGNDVDYWAWPLGLMAYPVGAALILARRPGNGVGLMLGVVATASLLIFGPHWFAVNYIESPLSRPAELLSGVAVIPQFGGMVALLHVFPTGRPLGVRHARAVTVYMALLAATAVVFVLSPGPLPLTGRSNPFGILPAWTADSVGAWFFFVLVLAPAVAGLGALVVRHRRADAMQRSQLRWFLTGAVVMVVMFASLDAFENVEVNPFVEVGAQVVLVAAGFWSLPAAVVVAVTRHHLYGIDRLISRVVTYGLVVGLLVATYTGMVLVIRGMFPLQSDGAVAVSTLAVAALFNPIRGRVQRQVDHRFNRCRFDAELELEHFARRMRDDLDLDHLTGDLLTVVTNTVQPADATVWIRNDPA